MARRSCLLPRRGNRSPSLTSRGNHLQRALSVIEVIEVLVFVSVERSFPCANCFPSFRIFSGDLFSWRGDWGEQLEGSACPVIVLLNIEDMRAQVIEKSDYSLGQAIFTVDSEGIVGVERLNTPYRLGSIFCNNRLQSLFYYHIKSKTFESISAPDKCAFCPRFDQSGKTLVFLQNEVGGPHQMAAELLKINWASDKRDPIVVVEIPANPKENEFPGLYMPKLMDRCILDDGKTLLFNSIWHSRLVILRIDLELGTVVNETADEEYGAWSLFDIHNGYVLASRSSPSIKPHVIVGKVGGDSIDWLTVTDPIDVPNTKWELMKLRPADAPDHFFEAIHIYGNVDKNLPLIVSPHGGPHAVSTLGYMKTVQFFVDCGYGVLFVNYRGSVGFGEVNLRSLPGRIGDVDVKDVFQAAAAVNERYKSTAVLFGGSHGGFLSAHLVGQYPSAFKAAALRNPVCSLSMMGPTDIPDWCWYEAGCEGKFKHDSLPSRNDLAQALSVSPMSHAHKITAPCFFFLGLKDQRVDKGQGIQLFKHLRARGVDTKCKMYDDNHSLSKVKHESDAYISSVEWFERYISRP
ncbi:acylamino-acid-releasing enzyme [Galendromus occidentalis]|uniref:acylaminoacyl-peptidase n=1 Tax=Galendromus occidentalis TaxID=34638 RepID=A0AAJ7SD78_9ACAR|nr:acylamino-acid-releasing enzyme [Galendromus occidentalis]